ncbi:MAG: sigma-70 family RNA polymerase sigma factor [Armatimonadetes bacterium]|nr:sigma-70 family RNA polymerase sigma factor [Armatimonadota bacterium]MDW8153976.1 sigma-70 family RNA polymerase sigma factor [Armatimonadota bacterium]
MRPCSGGSSVLCNRYFLRMVGDGDAAEELVCETMAAVWKSASRFRGEARASSWIFGIAHRRALDFLRRQPRQVSLGDAGALPAQMDPEEEAERADLVERVRKALSQLSPEHREVVHLVFDAGLSYQEVAEVLGVPVNTVKTRMFHARQKLRGLLEREGV